ncbi:hypothetical protein OU995_23475 [Roseateles sp. SL47]|uniref:hypothetical protein n=1 Tax=Roseateles sp. SL47 TaxID=2995138 RepID=UPI00226F259E|nr:hypothetical protein [Roseateles sp. SL47]WAC72477.1 hypothetical protein OU995_23475 [Roseateles sp. SL47]
MPKFSKFDSPFSSPVGRAALRAERLSVSASARGQGAPTDSAPTLSDAEHALVAAMDAHPERLTWGAAVSGVFDIE